MSATVPHAEPPLTEPAAYHCQQAAEKLFKGLLVGRATTVPRTHDLERLAALLVAPYPGLACEIKALARLTPWAEVTRYPQLEVVAGLSDDDVRQAIACLTTLYDRVKRLPSQTP